MKKYCENCQGEGYLEELRCGNASSECCGGCIVSVPCESCWGESEKRYVASIEVYVYGASKKEAEEEAEDICDLIGKKYDNDPRVKEVVERNFGKI